MPAQAAVLNKQRLNMVGANFFKFSIGQVDYNSQPELVELMTETARNQLLVNYLICESERRKEIDRNNSEQVDYVRRFWGFMISNPTPDQIMKWQEQHPFPKGKMKDARLMLRSEHNVIALRVQDNDSELMELSEIPKGVYVFTNGIGTQPERKTMNDKNLLVFTAEKQLEENRNFQVQVHDLAFNSFSGLSKERVTIEVNCFGEKSQTITNFTWVDIGKGFYDIGLDEPINATPGKPCLLWIEGEGLESGPVRIKVPSFEYNVLFEVHKLTDGLVYLIGFVENNVAEELKNKDTTKNNRLTLYSDQWEKATEIVTIPLTRILSEKGPRGIKVGDVYLLAWDMEIR